MEPAPCVEALAVAFGLSEDDLKREKDRGTDNGLRLTNVADREARTKKQRLDQLRWDLLQTAYQGLTLTQRC